MSISIVVNLNCEIRTLVCQVKVYPGLMDTLTDRRQHLMVFLEDYNRESVNKTTLRLRRIIYGILFADCDEGEVIKVTGGFFFDRARFFLC